MRDHELWEASSQAWLETVEKDANRTHLLDPLMLELCGDVTGKVAVDVGCGEGRFVRMLRERGATCYGVDPTASIVASGGDVRAFGESFPFADGSLDLVISYLSLCDIGPYREAISEWSRALKPGARLVVADVHPMCCVPYWVKDEHGRKLHRIIDNYFDESPQRVQWSGMDVVNYSRSLTSLFSAFHGAGLTLETLIEPTPTVAAVAEKPHLAEERRVPNFLVTVWRKGPLVQFDKNLP